MTLPDGWQWTEIAPGIGFGVPPDARRAGGSAVDSAAGIFDGDGYRITYDLGRFGERLDELGEPSRREVARLPAREVAFAPSDEPFAWARVVQVELGSGRTLTVRVSCRVPERCSLADGVFDSILVRP